MSLTNPNDVITEERLAEFYGQILPYLGGMPEMLANKFSRGDLYSESEKIIGQWIDGKPLYQRTFEYNPAVSVPTIGTNGAQVAIIPNIDLIVNGTAINNSNGSCPINTTIFWVNNGSEVRVSSSVAFEMKYCTLQYTKTTDSAIAIGSDTDYSTTEKIVGTWIDGKPLYQKTISTTLPDGTVGTISTKTIDIGAAVDYAIVEDAVICSGNTYFSMLYLDDNKSGMAKVSIANNSAGSPNKVIISASRWFNTPCYITIRYTKAT